MTACRCVLIAGALIASAVAGFPAENAAPLEATRKELRKLEGGQGTRAGPSASEGLRPAMPVLEIPGQTGSSAMPLFDPEKLEKERKRRGESRKNWLVNGVEQLEKSDKEKEQGLPQLAQADPPESTEASQETSREADPQYLLKLYDEQKRIEDARSAETKPVKAPPADPLAPFLQGWLGNSPVKGRFFDEFVRRSDTNGSASAVSAHPGRSEVGGNVPSGAASIGSPAVSDPKPNPYLAPVNIPPPTESGAVFDLLRNPANPPAAAVIQEAPLVRAAEAPADSRPPERKPPPAPLADDKKYFPQLKRF